MDCGGITKDSISKKVDPRGACSLGVKANSVFSPQRSRWNHGRCSEIKGVTPTFLGNLTCRKCYGNIEKAVEQEINLCDEVVTVR